MAAGGELPDVEIDAWTPSAMQDAQRDAPDGMVAIEACGVDEDVDLALLASSAAGLLPRALAIRIEGCSVSSLAVCCPAAAELTLAGGSLGAECRWSGDNWPSLTSLDLSGASGWQAAAAGWASALPRLRRLALSGCDLDDDTLAAPASHASAHCQKKGIRVVASWR